MKFVNLSSNGIKFVQEQQFTGGFFNMTVEPLPISCVSNFSYHKPSSFCILVNQ